MTDWFEKARYGLFIHFGLYSMLGRGEWVVNREEISPEELRGIADRFRPDLFDAEHIADLAVAGGMRYLVFTTMHHEGYRMYHSDLTDFCSTKKGPKRDFVAEIIAAARKRGLRIALYHSLNNWYDQPDAVAALEDKAAYQVFMENTLARIKELATRYKPFDTMWYDGWWPFDAKGWQGERMNEMVRAIQPDILFNGRNCLPGDFATPEQHITPPTPWRPWEACITLNDNWGYHAGDHNWKPPVEVIKMLVKVAQGKGNLLLNIGPKGDGSVPEQSERIIRAVGDWLKVNGEAIFETDLWTFDLQRRDESHRGDWTHHGPFTVRGNHLYLVATSFPGNRLVVTGLEGNVLEVRQLGGAVLPHVQKKNRVEVTLNGAPPSPDQLPVVFRLTCDRPPSIYKTGGLCVPAGIHPRYDPITSDLIGL